MSHGVNLFSEDHDVNLAYLFDTDNDVTTCITMKML